MPKSPDLNAVLVSNTPKILKVTKDFFESLGKQLLEPLLMRSTGYDDKETHDLLFQELL
jgi:hypothetical protein